MQQIILLGRQKRNQVQIKVKTPLKRLTIIHKDKNLLNEIAKLSEYLKTELNIKNIEFSTEEDKFITLYAKPNLPILGKKLGKNMGKYKALIEKLDSSKLTALEETDALLIDDIVFSQEEILIFREPKTGTQSMSNRFISIDIDTVLDQDLINEGLAREIVNRIQKSRKDSNFNVGDRIEVQYFGDDGLLKVVDQFREYITGETLAVKMEKATGVQELEYEIDEMRFSVSLKKC